jgi:hypothetical protein
MRSTGNFYGPADQFVKCVVPAAGPDLDLSATERSRPGSVCCLKCRTTTIHDCGRVGEKVIIQHHSLCNTLAHCGGLIGEAGMLAGLCAGMDACYETCCAGAGLCAGLIAGLLFCVHACCQGLVQ